MCRKSQRPARKPPYTLTGGVLFAPGQAFAAPELITSPLPLLATFWGIAALLGLLLLFAWNRSLKKRLAFQKKLNTALTRTTRENTERVRNSMKQITAVINTVPSPVFYKDRHGVYLGCNDTFARMILGLTPGEIVGKALTDMPDKIPPELAKTYQAKDQELIDNPGTQFYEANVKCADGEIRDFFFSKATMVTPKGEVNGIAGVMLDITQRKKAEEELIKSRERFRCLQEASFGGVIIHERGRIIDCNKALADMTGYTREELVGMDGFKLISPEDRTQVMNRILSGSETPYDAVGIHKNGTNYPLEIKARIMPVQDRLVRVAELRNISERKKAEEEREALIASLDETNRQLRELTLIDPLTGIYARDHAVSLLYQELKKAKRKDRAAIVMLADVDDFRHINHLHGSTFGDRTLQRISRTIVKCVREVDLVGRFGGDEFLVVLPDTDLEKGKEVAERVRHSVESLGWKAADFTVTVSIGVAAYDPREDNDPLKDADRLLSRARTRGANRIEPDD